MRISRQRWLLLYSMLTGSVAPSGGLYFFPNRSQETKKRKVRRLYPSHLPTIKVALRAPSQQGRVSLPYLERLNPGRRNRYTEERAFLSSRQWGTLLPHQLCVPSLGSIMDDRYGRCIHHAAQHLDMMMMIMQKASGKGRVTPASLFVGAAWCSCKSKMMVPVPLERAAPETLK